MSVSCHRRALMLFTALSLISGAGHAGAQDSASQTDKKEEATVLPKVVVKGDRVKGSVDDTPLATKTDRETLAKRDIQSIADLGNTEEAGVSYSSRSKGFALRGLDDDRILTTIDGIAIPYLDDRLAWNFSSGGVDSFDFSSLAGVSILRGADSSRAGSGALGGAVVLRTLEPEDLIGEGKDWGGFATTLYDGSDRSIKGAAALAKKIDGTSLLLQGSYKRGNETDTKGTNDGTGSTRTVADPADTYTSNLLFKLRQELEGGHTIGLTAEQFKSREDSDKMSSYSSTYTSYDYHSDTTRDRVSLDYEYEAIAEDAWLKSARASLYYQHMDRDEGYLATRTTAPVGTYGRSTESRENTVGFIGSASSEFQTGLLKHEVTVGTDLAFFGTHSYTTGTDTCGTNYVSACAYYHVNQSDTPDVDGSRIGAFIDDRIEIGNSGVSVTPGLRFDYFDYRPQASAAYEANDGYSGLPASVSDSAFSPKLRAEWAVSPEVTLFAQWAMSFRAPTVAQLYGNYDNAPYYRMVGNPDLDAETGNGFELGADLGSADRGLRLSTFYNRYRNFIDTEVSAESGYRLGTYRYFNRNRVRIYGAEAKAHADVGHGFELHSSLAYANAEDLDTGEVLDSVAPLKAIIGAGYSQDNWGTNVDWILSKGVSNLSTATYKAPGYGIVNLTAWWEPEQLKGLRVQAGVYNLFDREYYDAMETKDVTSVTSANRAFYSEPGRYLKISLTKTF
ncbi:TonB-dependent hemoglobin/transferrin/lactoferrin family receptor [Rhizobium sp. CSW-27]|nr:TonB-dependent hemoglobin/transferrin/lactoferrin family receptor [Rhizobium sp. CSW-27]